MVLPQDRLRQADVLDVLARLQPRDFQERLHVLDCNGRSRILPAPHSPHLFLYLLLHVRGQFFLGYLLLEVVRHAPSSSGRDGGFPHGLGPVHVLPNSVFNSNNAFEVLGLFGEDVEEEVKLLLVLVHLQELDFFYDRELEFVDRPVEHFVDARLSLEGRLLRFRLAHPQLALVVDLELLLEVGNQALLFQEGFGLFGELVGHDFYGGGELPVRSFVEAEDFEPRWGGGVPGEGEAGVGDAEDFELVVDFVAVGDVGPVYFEEGAVFGEGFYFFDGFGVLHVFVELGDEADEVVVVLGWVGRGVRL